VWKFYRWLRGLNLNFSFRPVAVLVAIRLFHLNIAYQLVMERGNDLVLLHQIFIMIHCQIKVIVFISLQLKINVLNFYFRNSLLSYFLNNLSLIYLDRMVILTLTNFIYLLKGIDLIVLLVCNSYVDVPCLCRLVEVLIGQITFIRVFMFLNSCKNVLFLLAHVINITHEFE
jgi:hypothetical protein